MKRYDKKRLHKGLGKCYRNLSGSFTIAVQVARKVRVGKLPLNSLMIKSKFGEDLERSSKEHLSFGIFYTKKNSLTKDLLVINSREF